MNQTASITDLVGHTRKEEDEVTLGAVRRMAAMLDQDPDVWRHGSEMPESWYVILFGPVAPQGTLVRDGHLPTGDFLPPMGDARRMFGGRRVRFYQPVRVGDRVERVSKVTRAEKKIGRSGPLTLVTVVHELNAGSGVAITEEQDIVYRTPVATGVSARSDAGRGRVESRIGRALSCQIPCSCSAIRRSPSTLTAFITTCRIPAKSRVILLWS